jgi:hypothetical protein
MLGTNSKRSYGRTQRWLKTAGSGIEPSDQAWGLLSLRLAARRRAALRCAPLLLVALGFLASTVFPTADLGTAEWGRRFAVRYLMTIGCVAVATIVGGLLGDAAERKIAAGLPRRVTRAAVVPIRILLGGVRSIFVVTAAALEAASAVALLIVHAGWLAQVYLAAICAIDAWVAVALWRAARRPTIALDASSLAIDERLRSLDAHAAGGPLYLVQVAFPASLVFDSTPRWFGPPWVAEFAVVSGLWFWAQLRDPWRAANSRAAGSLSASIPGAQR